MTITSIWGFFTFLADMAYCATLDFNDTNEVIFLYIKYITWTQQYSLQKYFLNQKFEVFNGTYFKFQTIKLLATKPWFKWHALEQGKWLKGTDKKIVRRCRCCPGP